MSCKMGKVGRVLVLSRHNFQVRYSVFCEYKMCEYTVPLLRVSNFVFMRRAYNFARVTNKLDSCLQGAKFEQRDSASFVPMS